MEVISRKRRSEDSTFVQQSKMFVTERMAAAKDSSKMKQVHEKTIQMLFQAARSLKLIEVDEQTGPAHLNQAHQPPLSQQFSLCGNGQIHLSNFHQLDGDKLDRSKSSCCNRDTHIHDKCSSCTFVLCEYCGYSCGECGAFLCHGCVSLFGCGTTDRPKCEKCAFYH